MQPPNCQSFGVKLYQNENGPVYYFPSFEIRKRAKIRIEKQEIKIQNLWKKRKNKQNKKREV